MGETSQPTFEMVRKWNHYISKDEVPSRENSSKPNGADELFAVEEVDGRHTYEADLLKIGLSTARAAPPEKEMTPAGAEVVKAGDAQDAAADQEMKRGRQRKAAPKRKAFEISDKSAPPIAEKLPEEIVNPGPTAEALEKKEALVNARLTKRPRTGLMQKKTVGDGEVAITEVRVEDVPNVGDTLSLPLSEKSVEERNIAMKTSILQTLKHADDLSAQMRKLCLRVKELEAENAKAKDEDSKVKALEGQLAMALREKAIAEQNKEVALQEKSAALKEKSSADQATIVERLGREAAENSRQLAEKDAANLRAQVAGLQSQVTEIQQQQIKPGPFARLLIKKIKRTRTFGEFVVTMGNGATKVGIHRALKNIMGEYPELKLRKRGLGWDPHASERLNALQVEMFKGETKFPFIDELDKLDGPIDLKQIEAMTTDYDPDLDEKLKPIPDNYPCEDDDDEEEEEVAEGSQVAAEATVDVVENEGTSRLPPESIQVLPSQPLELGHATSSQLLEIDQVNPVINQVLLELNNASPESTSAPVLPESSQADPASANAQNDEPHSSQMYKLETALEKHLASRIHELRKELVIRKDLIETAYHKLKHQDKVLQVMSAQLQACFESRQNAETLLQEKTCQMAEMQRTIDEQNAKVRTFQSKLSLAMTQNNALNDRVAIQERRLNGQPVPDLTPEICLQFLKRDANQTAEIYGADSVLAKAKQRRLDQLPQTDSQQGSRCEMPIEVSNQMPTSPNTELAAALEKIKRVEEALRVKTLQWQELHMKFEQLPPQTQGSVSQDNASQLQLRLGQLQEKLMIEKLSTRALNSEIIRLRCERDKLPVPIQTEEQKTFQIMEDAKHAEEVYGEGSKEHKLKQGHLDGWIRKLIDNAELKAKAIHAKERAQRQAQFQEARNARLAKEQAEGKDAS